MKRLILLATILALSSCCGLSKPSRAIHDTAHQEYINYVIEDGSLDLEQKALRIRNIQIYGEILDEYRN